VCEVEDALIVPHGSPVSGFRIGACSHAGIGPGALFPRHEIRSTYAILGRYALLAGAAKTLEEVRGADIAEPGLPERFDHLCNLG
jgi:hypothetical protein